MSKKPPPIPGPDSGVSDFDENFNLRARAVPDRFKDDYTPITNLGDLGPAISAIKRGQDRTTLAVNNLDDIVRQEVKPKLDEVREGFIRLETEHKATKSRVRVLETDTREILVSPAVVHDCYHEGDIKELGEEHKTAQADIAIVKTDVVAVQAAHVSTKETLDKDVGRIDGRSKTVLGISVSVFLFALGGIGAALGAFYTTQANVEHLSSEQTKIRDEVAEMKTAHVKASSEIQSAAELVEEVATKVGEPSDPLDRIWCDLSAQERRRQKRLRGASEVPRRKCR